MTLGTYLYIVWATAPGRRPVERVVIASSVEEALEAAKVQWATEYHVRSLSRSAVVAMT